VAHDAIPISMYFKLIRAMLLIGHIYKYCAGCSKKDNSSTDSFKRRWIGQYFSHFLLQPPSNSLFVIVWQQTLSWNKRIQCTTTVKPFGHLNSSKSFMQNVNILRTKKVTLW